MNAQYQTHPREGTLWQCWEERGNLASNPFSPTAHVGYLWAGLDLGSLAYLLRSLDRWLFVPPDDISIQDPGVKSTHRLWERKSRWHQSTSKLCLRTDSLGQLHRESAFLEHITTEWWSQICRYFYTQEPPRIKRPLWLIPNHKVDQTHAG